MAAKLLSLTNGLSEEWRNGLQSHCVDLLLPWLAIITPNLNASLLSVFLLLRFKTVLGLVTSTVPRPPLQLYSILSFSVIQPPWTMELSSRPISFLTWGWSWWNVLLVCVEIAFLRLHLLTPSPKVYQWLCSTQPEDLYQTVVDQYRLLDEPFSQQLGVSILRNAIFGALRSWPPHFKTGSLWVVEWGSDPLCSLRLLKLVSRDD